MKALLQRVTSASVSVDGIEVGRIGPGLCVLVGVAAGDTPKDIDYLVSKLVNLRIFADEAGKFNLSLMDMRGEMLLVSQFTLMADARHGRRPGFTAAAPPEVAEKLFNLFVDKARATGLRVATGRFQAYMRVEIINDGPVTIMLDSRDKIAGRFGLSVLTPAWFYCVVFARRESTRLRQIRLRRTHCKLHRESSVPIYHCEKSASGGFRGNLCKHYSRPGKIAIFGRHQARIHIAGIQKLSFDGLPDFQAMPCKTGASRVAAWANYTVQTSR